MSQTKVRRPLSLCFPIGLAGWPHCLFHIASMFQKVVVLYIEVFLAVESDDLCCTTYQSLSRTWYNEIETNKIGTEVGTEYRSG